MINFYHRETAATTFANLKPGDIFRKPNSEKGFCYLKTCTGDAVNLITGEAYHFDGKQSIKILYIDIED